MFTCFLKEVLILPWRCVSWWSRDSCEAKSTDDKSGIACKFVAQAILATPESEQLRLIVPVTVPNGSSTYNCPYSDIEGKKGPDIAMEEVIVATKGEKQIPIRSGRVASLSKTISAKCMLETVEESF